MKLPDRVADYIGLGLSPEEPFTVSEELFHRCKIRRELFVEKLDLGEYYLLFRKLPAGSSFRPIYSSDIRYAATVEILISKSRSTNVVTFGNYLVFTYELYGKEWFALKII